MQRFFAIAVVAGFSAFAVPAAAATVTFAEAAFAAFTPGDAGIRVRAQNTGEELYVGVNDLGAAPNRRASEVKLTGTQNFNFLYEEATGVLTATVGLVTQTFTAKTPADYNALRVDIRGPRQNGRNGLNSFSLTDLTLNGTMIADLIGPVALPNTVLAVVLSDFERAVRKARPGTSSAAGGSFKPGVIQFAGKLNYAGPGGNASAEAAKVEVRFGNVPEPAPVPLPAALPLLAAGLGGLGFAASRRRR
jgi:hypothetical protein